MCNQEIEKKRANLRSFVYNLGGGRPWLEKVRLFVRNNWIKARHLQNCCGHPGEPGC